MLYKHFEEFLPDILITDLVLPDGRGVELLPSTVEARSFPVVVMTSYGNEQIAVEALKAGALDYIVKSEATLSDMPHIIERTLREWEHIIERKRAEEELRTLNAELEQKVADRTRELNEALEKEKELNKLKTSFVSMVSHEFRNPLTTILSLAQLLRLYSHKLPKEKQIEYLKNIQVHVERMATMLDDILIIGSSDLGRLKCKPGDTDVEKICREIIEDLQLTSKNNIINFIYNGRGIKAHIDEKLLRHILNNLLSNAIKYSPEGSTVDFELDCEAENLLFRIRDQGIGIPEEDQKCLFESFHRASNVGIVSGTGLGLSIVKRCIDLHGGQIDFSSQVGTGTTFTVFLPHK